MLNDRVKELLDYLNVLSQVQGAGHYVNDEIKECVKEIRIELGLEKKKQDTLKASRFLVFEAKLGQKATPIQRNVFETVYGSTESEIEILFFVEQDAEVDTAVTVLKSMKAPVTFDFYQYTGNEVVGLTVKR